MAIDCFLKIQTIPGESTDDKHQDWIEILSYSFGVAQSASGSHSTAGARSGGRADFSDFVATHLLDKASPKLAISCSKGEHIQTVTLSLNRAGGSKEEYMEYKLEDVIITSVSTSGQSGSEGALPIETISFNYGRITFTYTETDHKTGAPKGKVSSGWDLIANKPI